MKAFGEQGSAVGIDFSGVISFNNGSPGTFSGNPADYEPAFRFANLLVGTAENPSDRITVNNVYTYDPEGTIADDGNVSFGYTAQGNKGLVVKDNYIAGGQSLFALKGGWDDATVTGNTFYATSVFDVNANSALVSVQDLPQAYSYLWDRNAYFDGTPAKNCYGDSKRAPFYFGNVYSPCNQSAGGPLDFSEWRQSLGFDANSTYAEGRPAGITIFIRPNRYEAGRAHVAVYNWDLRPAVTLNLSESGLTSGQRYEIRDAQNYFGSPLVSATYNAKKPLVSIPMTNLSVAAPIGSNFVPPHTAPEFGAFVVLPVSKENNSPSHCKDR
jgi:hypothetical protein